MSYESYVESQREKLSAECEWHEGQPKHECPECESAYEAYQENLMDAMREER